MSDSIVLAAVGDVLVDRDDPMTSFAHVHELLASADLRFGNCEAVYSDTPERIVGGAGKFLSPPGCFEAVRSANFDVMSFANNHALDGGYTGFFETLELLHGAGVATAGAGANLDEARQPAIVEADGVKVAVLGYTCVYPPGTGAAGSRPGMAALEVHTVYRGEVGQPGTRPKVATMVDPGDLAWVQADVARARERADLVAVSVHMGIHMLPAVLADYERQLAHAVVDAGADVVLGHHQHILKGIEIYRGRPIFYGLGNFVVDLGHGGPPTRSSHMNPYQEFYGEYAAYPREGSRFPFHDESRLTMIALLRADSSGLLEASLIPCRIDQGGSPAPIDPASAEFGQFRVYLREIGERAGFTSDLNVRDGRLVVEGVTAAAELASR
jgi:poly-gamma-glutamate synthesis protein (capsule biosynthesis protein)